MFDGGYRGQGTTEEEAAEGLNSEVRALHSPGASPGLRKLLVRAGHEGAGLLLWLAVTNDRFSSHRFLIDD